MAYEEVGVEEAIDLIETLPHGSMYVSKLHPQFSWSKEREAIADLQDTILRFMYGDGARVVRPTDVIAQRKAAAKAERTRETIEKTQWVEV